MQASHVGYKFHYDSARGWDVSAAFERGDFIACGVSRSGNAFDLSHGMDGFGRWQLGFPSNSPEGSLLTLDMDLDRFSDALDAAILREQSARAGRDRAVSLGGAISAVALTNAEVQSDAIYADQIQVGQRAWLQLTGRAQDSLAAAE